MGATILLFGGDSLMEDLQAGRCRQLTVDLSLAREIACKLKGSLNDQLLGILLFGSVARGDETAQSDLDLLVVLRELTALSSQQVALALSDYDESVVVQLADPSMLFANVLVREPFTLGAFAEGIILHDSWLLGPLQVVSTRSGLLANVHTGAFLLNRAKKRICESRRAVDVAYQHALAAFTDCGFAVCHYFGKAPHSTREMLACIEEYHVPSSITRKVRAAISKVREADIHALLHEADQFVAHVEEYLQRQRTE